jgi:tRNA/tmRNA/rRNA uracil-C5-methylase (TrmA/RlmC/RlmD family)
MLLEATFHGFDPDGASRGQSNGQPVLSWGVLPGERARLRRLRRRGRDWLCLPEEIFTAAPGRLPPREDHYLSCSPWQVFDYPLQVDWKQKLLAGLFPDCPQLAFHRAPQLWHYRNKLEFSFTEQHGRPVLAFHERWNPLGKVALPAGCALGRGALNRAGLAVANRLAELGVTAAQLKSLIVRCSRSEDTVVGALYVTDPAFPATDIRGPELAGLAVIFSDPQSPASVTTRELARFGTTLLGESVAGLPLEYDVGSFFQVYPEMFDHAVEELQRRLGGAGRVVEFYSGVGSIGLVLCRQVRQVVAIESETRAVELARHNAEALGADNFLAVAGRAEQLAEAHLAGADAVVLDPPRSGLHPRVVAALLRDGPPRILYLSCHPPRQARDVNLLAPAYRVAAVEGFDFYPQTPHSESLVVLERR